jgi:hypothetical protein
MNTPDPRIPVIFGTLDQAGPGDAVLFEGRARPWCGASASFAPDPGHAAGCACCQSRLPAGRVLGALLHARARSEIPYFQRVLAVVPSEEGRLQVERALAEDPLASACFKLG